MSRVPVRVLVADDHPVVRAGVVYVLESLGGFEVVAQVADGRAVLSAPQLDVADVLVLDLSLPKVSGTEVLRRVRSSHPRLAVVVLSTHPADQFAWRTLADGAAFYIGKDQPPQVLLDAVRDAAAGKRATDDPSASGERQTEAPHTRLSSRENQVFTLIIEGRSVVDIAAELDVAACTVSNHVAKIRTKLGAKTTADIVGYAYAAGLVGRPPE